LIPLPARGFEIKTIIRPQNVILKTKHGNAKEGVVLINGANTRFKVSLLQNI
jgi:hypothetical protein